MTILAVADAFPMPDRTGGDQRFARILEWMARHDKVFLACTRQRQQLHDVGAEDFSRYRTRLESLGIAITEPHLALGLTDVRCVLFELHGLARRWLVPIRDAYPKAAVIIDSVDVHYVRLFGQAQIAGSRRHFRRARRVRSQELSAYKAADLVLAVSEEDCRMLLGDIPGLRTFVMPNIHPIPQLDQPVEQDPNSLIFIGSYAHEPNVDAMIWFCNHVLPVIAEAFPDVRLKIIGSNMSPAIRSLAGPRVEVLGFEPETAPYLRSSAISIAPIRFGAGMKGKVGEALAFGLSVVSTDIGISGIGLSPGVNVLVGNTEREFADATIRLLRDPALRARLGSEGRAYIAEFYSETAAAHRLAEIFNVIVPGLTPRRPSFLERLRWQLRGRLAAKRDFSQSS